MFENDRCDRRPLSPFSMKHIAYAAAGRQYNSRTDLIGDLVSSVPKMEREEEEASLPGYCLREETNFHELS